MNVQGRHVSGIDALFADDARPGDFAIRRVDDGEQRYLQLMFLCPCGGHGEIAGVKIAAHGMSKPPSPAWEWDGDFDKPTLTPSIQRNDECRWHGFLRAGVWESV